MARSELLLRRSSACAGELARPSSDAVLTSPEVTVSSRFTARSGTQQARAYLGGCLLALVEPVGEDRGPSGEQKNQVAEAGQHDQRESALGFALAVLGQQEHHRPHGCINYGGHREHDA